MKSITSIIVSALLFTTLVFAELNVYKKNFDTTGRAYYFNPSEEYKGYKVAVGQDCTKVVVTLKDANGAEVPLTDGLTLSTAAGYTYSAEAVKFSNGLCTLPDSQTYNKQVISSTPEDLVNYYNGKTSPIEKYNFETKNMQESGIFGNTWVLIGIIGGSVALILIIVVVVVVIKKKRNQDEANWNRYSKRISSDDDMNIKTDMPNKLFGNDQMKEKDVSYSISTPYNIKSKSPYMSNDYDISPNLGGNMKNDTYGNFNLNNSDDNLLNVTSEPKRITSLTYEEQQSYTNILKKNTGGSSKSRTNIPDVPEEYEKYKTFKVIRKFTPQRNDELVVEIGQLLKMIKSFEDGWTLCYNIETEKEGYIPKNKLIQNDPPTKTNILHSNSGNSQSTVNSTKPLLHSSSGASQGSSYYSNNNSYNRKPKPNGGNRAVNSRNNSNSSRGFNSNERSPMMKNNYAPSPNMKSPNPGAMKSPNPGAMKSPNPNKYYRKPSNEGYGNYNRSPNPRYDI